ncbi:hypothetical protein [Kingella sp. (in: b-proteobacteria)]|uniref:hypothetical protein n=1 Tax=Kingella sp. (in: b-proteobacteria) TaxID=2020713 RepID=UPI0026DA811F|nr:hypothetical protein [Kingella sp. (in: b-proteobacteria)]MDO4657800.1 hypothetical protein [Kingella sp. (in: b-proteobacteria)]
MPDLQRTTRQPRPTVFQPALRCKNAGANAGQPETLTRAPTACLQAVRWLK